MIGMPPQPRKIFSKLTRAIALQARCLALDCTLYDQTAQLTALGPICRAISAWRKPDDLAALLDLVLPLVDQVTQADGEHKSRMPDMHLKLMRNLVESATQHPRLALTTPPSLTRKLQMASICRMWRMLMANLPVLTGRHDGD